MLSRRHSSATLCSPRSPSSTTRIFSSAEYCLRVARRMSRTIRSDDKFGGAGFLAHLHSSTVTMSQKSSFPQTLESVSQALTPDRVFFRLYRWSSMARHARLLGQWQQAEHRAEKYLLILMRHLR